MTKPTIFRCKCCKQVWPLAACCCCDKQARGVCLSCATSHRKGACRC